MKGISLNGIAIENLRDSEIKEIIQEAIHLSIKRDSCVKYSPHVETNSKCKHYTPWEILGISVEPGKTVRETIIKCLKLGRPIMARDLFRIYGGRVKLTTISQELSHVSKSLGKELILKEKRRGKEVLYCLASEANTINSKELLLLARRKHG